MTPPLTRLKFLERAVSGLMVSKGSGADSEGLTPNYLTIDPVTGAVGADFTGKITAEGLDLPAGTTTTPSNEDRIRWIRQSDGGVVADLSAFSVPGTGEAFNLKAYALAQANQSEANLLATDDLGTNQAGLLVTQTNRGTVAVVQVLAGALIRTILDQGGGSSFLLNSELFQVASVQLVFTASTKAAEVAVNHNLGSVPTSILITPVGDPGVVLAPYAKNLGSNTTANIGGYTTAAITANKTVAVWIFK